MLHLNTDLYEDITEIENLIYDLNDMKSRIELQKDRCLIDKALNLLNEILEKVE